MELLKEGVKESDTNMRKLDDTIKAIGDSLEAVGLDRDLFHQLIHLDDITRAKDFREELDAIRKASVQKAADIDFDLGIRKLGGREQGLATDLRGIQLERDTKVKEAREEGLTGPDLAARTTDIDVTYDEIAAKSVSSFNKQAEASADFFGGMEKGLNDYFDASEDIFGQSADWVSGSFDKMGDALAEFVVTGKMDFKGLALSIIQDLTSMIAKQMLFNAVKMAGSAMGFADGGIIDGSFQATPAANGAIWAGNFQPIQAFASGTPKVEKPTLGLVGEGRFPEAIVPLPDGRSIPAKIEGMGEAMEKVMSQQVVAPATPQNIRIVNAFDTAVVGDYIGSDPGEKAILNVVKRNKTTIQQMMG